MTSLQSKTGSASLPTSSKEPPNFDGPTLHPVPLTDDPTSPEASVGVFQFEAPDVWDFLRTTDPIDDPSHLAMHVASLTLGMAELKRRIDEIVWVDEDFIRSLMEKVK